MREACLYTNGSFVSIFLKIYRTLMRWIPWSFLGRWWWWVLTMGALPRMRSGGSGDEGSLPNSFGWGVILFTKTHLYRGALTLHFMEEHSSPGYIYISCFHEDVIKWKHVPRHWLLCGEFTGDCGEFIGHRWISLTQTSDVEFWYFLWSSPEQTVE